MSDGAAVKETGSKAGRKLNYRKPNPHKNSKSVRLTDTELSTFCRACEVVQENESQFMRKAIGDRAAKVLKQTEAVPRRTEG